VVVVVAVAAAVVVVVVVVVVVAVVVVVVFVLVVDASSAVQDILWRCMHEAVVCQDGVGRGAVVVVMMIAMVGLGGHHHRCIYIYALATCNQREIRDAAARRTLARP